MAWFKRTRKGIQTKRYKNIIIKTAQEDSDWYFSGEEAWTRILFSPVREGQNICRNNSKGK